MSVTVALVITTLVLLAITMWLWHRGVTHKYSHIPGPSALPIIGHLPMIDRYKPYETFIKWSKIYGPVIKVHIPGQVFVVAIDFDTVHEMLVDKGIDFGGRPQGFRDSIMAKNTGIVGLDPHKKWRAIRRLIHSSMKVFGTGSIHIEQYALEMSQEFIQGLMDAKGKPVNPRDLIFEMTLGMTTLMLYGRKLNRSSPIFQKLKEMVELVDWSFHVGSDGPLFDLFPFLRFFDNKTYKVIQKATSHLNDIWVGYFKDMAPVDDTEQDDRLEKTLAKELRDHNLSVHDEDYLTEDEIRSTMLQMTFAGVNSISITLYELICAMLHYPKVKDKMYKEIQEVLGECTVSLNDRDKMPYTHAAIYEILRYNTGAPLSIPHRTICDTSLGGHSIPKDTVVLSSLWSVHLDKDFWSDPYTFRPERFLDQDGKLLSPESDVCKHFMMFGNGPRLCAGKLFAMYQMFLWSTTILQHFDIQPEPNVPSDDITKYHFQSATMRPPEFRALFIPRK